MIAVPDDHLADTWIRRPDGDLLVRTCRSRRGFTTSVFENVSANGTADLLVSVTGPDDLPAWGQHIDAVNRWKELPEETT